MERQVTEYCKKCYEIQKHYDQQLKAMCDKYNLLLNKTNKEMSDYGKELLKLRGKLNIAEEALAFIAGRGCNALKELDGE